MAALYNCIPMISKQSLCQLIRLNYAGYETPRAARKALTFNPLKGV